MSRLVRTCALLSIAASAIAGKLQGQTLTGIVKEDSTERPLAGAEIAIDGSNQPTRSAANGRFVMADVSQGLQRIHVRLLGYRPVDMLVTITAGQTRALDILLVRMPVALDTIAVTGRPTLGVGAGLEAFEERRRLGFGKFVDST